MKHARKRFENGLQRVIRKFKNTKTLWEERFLPTPSSEELLLIERLRADFNNPSHLTHRGNITDAWFNYSNNLRTYVNTRDPRNFLRWDIIENSMFHIANRAEFEFLVSQKDWPDWKSALRESAAGRPRPYRLMPETSGNTIHCAYHLTVLSRAFDIPLSKLNIFEFGGGYGAMARLLFNLGLVGTYYGFDLPEFLALQRYYLESAAIDTSKNAVFMDSLETLTAKPPKDIGLFIATWSLSESPLALREKILSSVNPHYYLIAYQQTFRDIDNRSYFKEMEEQLTLYEWKHFEIEHLPGNFYLLGKRK